MKEHKTDGGTASRLDGFPSNHIERGLARITAVLDAMDLRIESPVFTVGGTNGKGSTCAMLEAILGAAGYHVGCYTSPHLLDVTERIRLQGRPVSSRDHVTAIERVEAARERTSLTYFELMTLAALEVFTSKKVDVLILEVGLGGRLDAVNAVDADCAILTNVALDHTELLGTTREQIGLEKAGIMRRQRPAVCGDPDPPQSVRRYARDAGADLRCVGESYSFQASEDMWHFAGAEGSHLALPYPALVGAHQLGNAAAAIAAIESLAGLLPVLPQHIAQGLTEVRLSGRFQKVSNSPTLVLDVAHNPHAAACLADNLRRSTKGGRRISVLGMLAHKDVAGVLETTLPLFDIWLVAGISEPQGATASFLAGELNGAGVAVPVEKFEHVSAAFTRALFIAAPDDTIVVFGSFRTVAAVMEAADEMPVVERAGRLMGGRG